MAEALVHAPSRSQSIPQVSVKTQRLEELAIKQSRQLIPVTPSIPKALGSVMVLNYDHSRNCCSEDHTFERRLRLGDPLVKENIATMVLESGF